MKQSMNDVQRNIDAVSVGTTPNHAHTHKSARWLCNKMNTWIGTDYFVADTSPGSWESLTLLPFLR